jgi:hypothetical protein
MQMLGVMSASELLRPADAATEYPILSLAPLPFNPIRLLLLVAWFYLCVYLVQRVNFSPLVPKKYRVYANVVTLFTGPVLLLTLFLIDTARKTRETREGFFEVLTRQTRHAWTALRSARAEPKEDDSAIRLLDASG